MRKLVYLIIFCLLSFGVVEYARSHGSGETGHTNKAGDSPGCSCHCNTASASTTTTISTQATSFLVGQSYTFTITVDNPGESRAGCNISCFRGTLTAGTDGLRKSGTELTQSASKALTATWTFTYKAPATAGTDTIYAVGNAVNGDGSSDGNCSDEWSLAPKFIINVTAPVTSLSLSANSISFGSVRVGSSKSDTMTINSIGNASLTIASSGIIFGNIFTTSPTTNNRTIAAGSSEIETIGFHPTSRGVFLDTLVITDNATLVSDRRKTVTVTGKGVNGEYSGSNTINFGQVLTGKKKTFTYIFTNSGDDTLFLGGNPVVTGKGFSLESIPPIISIPPGGKDSVVIGFTPDSTIAFNGALKISALNSVAIPLITLSGTGIAPLLFVDSVNIDFGKCDTGVIQTHTFMYGNKGSADLTITGIKLTGDTSFSIGAVEVKVFAPLHLAIATVSFLPKSVGTFSGIVNIQSDVDSLSVRLHGEGVLPITTSVRSYPKNIDASISVSPNPSNGHTRVKIILTEPKEIAFEISDEGGKIIKEFDKISLQTGENSISLSPLVFPSGKYFLRAIYNGDIIAQTQLILVK